MNRLRIAQRLYNVPLLLMADKALILSTVLGGSAADLSDDFDALPEPARNALTGTARAPAARSRGGSGGRGQPYAMAESGVAIIAVQGSLVNRGAWIGSNSGLTSYEGLKHQLQFAKGDPDTKAVILDLDSPGGEAVGAFELAQVIRDLRTSKPVTAVVNGMAASAGYAIASAASRIVSIPTGITGSVGVVMLHADHSQRLEKAGIKPTLLHAGAHKVDGNPYEPLPESVRADIQAELAVFYELFVESVSAGRRGLSPKTIRDTEARVFIGKQALDAGLIDAIGTIDDVVAELSGRPMPMRTASKVPGLTTASLPAPQHSLSSAAERERILAILTCPEAQGRKQSAEHFALRTRLTVEEAIGVLSTVPLDRPADGGRGPLGLKIANSVEEIYACHGRKSR